MSPGKGDSITVADAVSLCIPLDKMAPVANDIFKRISVNEKFCILIKISLNFVPKGPVDNKPILV